MGGYGDKPSQNRVLKIKIPHHALSFRLSQCQCVDTNKVTRSKRESDSSGVGRVQWDPDRDMLSADGREPREMLRQRAIQIGLPRQLSEFYVSSIISILDVTELCHSVCEAHRSKKKDAVAAVQPYLPLERPYMPDCSEQCLVQLGMLPGQTASAIAKVGRGKAT